MQSSRQVTVLKANNHTYDVWLPELLDLIISLICLVALLNYSPSNCLLACSLQVFRPRTPPEAMDLIGLLLDYTPVRRIVPIESCTHAFFNELREENTRLPNGKPLPPLFNFSPLGTY